MYAQIESKSRNKRESPFTVPRLNRADLVFFLEKNSRSRKLYGTLAVQLLTSRKRKTTSSVQSLAPSTILRTCDKCTVELL